MSARSATVHAGTLCAQLRDRTRDAHERAESVPFISDLEVGTAVGEATLAFELSTALFAAPGERHRA